jgi:hypothetical protein
MRYPLPRERHHRLLPSFLYVDTNIQLGNPQPSLNFRIQVVIDFSHSAIN